MKSDFLTLALALTLAVPASAVSNDPDFAAELGTIGASLIGRTRDLKSRSPFQKTTQESGPNDPLLLMQKPMLDLIRKVESSVVLLVTKVPNKEIPDASSSNVCTGFFADAERELGRPSIIATNSHCVEHLDVGAEIMIGLYTGNDNRPRMAKGRVLAYGSSTGAKDIAFVELLDPSLNRKGLPLWSKLDVGEQVVAIGNPLGMTFSVSKGIVSALGRARSGTEALLDMNQADVAVNPGNSGGPLFNMWGSVVGINTLLVSSTGSGFEGISLSLPAQYISLAMKQYRRTGNLQMGSMQVALAYSPETRKLAVLSLVPGGPAEAARMLADDQVVAVDGIVLGAQAPEDAMKDLLSYVKYHSPGERITVTVRRGGRDLMLPVTLGESKPSRPEWAPIPKKGSAKPTSFEI